VAARRQGAAAGTVTARQVLAPTGVDRSAMDDKVNTISFAILGYEGVNEAREFGPLKAAIETRGFPCMIVRSPKTRTKTPNQDRAKVVVEALKSVQGDVALIGISNQGLFMPLVAAERPVNNPQNSHQRLPRGCGQTTMPSASTP
jgi:hypothetical protein